MDSWLDQVGPSEIETYFSLASWNQDVCTSSGQDLHKRSTAPHGRWQEELDNECEVTIHSFIYSLP